MFTETQCQYCGSRNFDVLKTERYASILFKILQCEICGHAFLSPKPKQNSVMPLYSNPKLNERARATEEQAFEYYENLLRHYVNRHFAATGRKRVLDLGCGLGTFLACAEKSGYEGYGIDINEASVEYAKGKHGVRAVVGSFYELEKHFERNSFDLLWMHHVLEHVFDPVKFIPYVSDFIRLQGLIVIGVPNIDSDDFATNGACWSYLQIPAHINYWSRMSMDILMLQKMRKRGLFFELLFHESFPPPGKREGEGFVSAYRLRVRMR